MVTESSLPHSVVKPIAFADTIVNSRSAPESGGKERSPYGSFTTTKA
jgi:hypothetical protein